ncbi:MAG: ABC transporter ATP-binding protein [Tractidigestivibacter sp.]|uniref:ABC transporter ATP-binding protein n=1 Tax=Tractidigestivibacter sp. TaxID=2847320 RepID=UPI002A822F6E|nr:ABC transporter ATP-binding protein [Tractidigestivibacter sp.]MDY4534320.1 ABC transporter ATP-binding protein [Tractidigestivibacter sp.]
MGEILRRFVFPKYRGKIVFGTLCKAVEVVFDLITPAIVASMIDAGVANRDAGHVVRMCVALVVLALVGFCFTLVCQKMAAVVSQGSGTDIRHDLYAKVNQLAPADLDRMGTPSLVTRLTNDVNQVQVTVALGIRQIIRWPILAVGSMVCAMLIDARLGLVFLVCTPAIAAVFWIVMSKSVPLFGKLQARLDEVSLVTRENLSGVRVVRAFRQEGREGARFHGAVDAQTRTAIAIGKLSSLLNPATLLVMDLGVVAILWMGGVRVDVGDLTQGEVIAFVNYMTQTLVSIVYVANLVITINRGTASAARIMEVLDCDPQISDEGAVEIPLGHGTLTSGVALALDHVGFTYDGAARPAVDGVTLRLGAGGALGIIGGTGSGKSSLANLILRLYDATEGEVRVFGHDVREYPLTQLRELVSAVPQQASLVSGTIRSNLCWRDGRAGDDELWRALALAQAADFVGATDGGLDATVEAGGRNFSGGQRQRLTIARALVGRPRIVVLDDAASALDFRTDATLRQSLRSLRSELTCVIVSQRVSSVMSCDQILVLDHGRMAGLGSHAELMRSCPIYREICLSQLRPEEVCA